MATPLGLLRESGLVRRNLIVFALMTAVINGLVTAGVGAWLAQTYASHQSRRQSVQNVADLIYERRTRGGMVISTLKRGADLDELRFRKRAYDEVFVEWNKKVQNNVLQIREVMGKASTTRFEKIMQDQLVPAMSAMDSCLTKAYDLKLAGHDPLPQINSCDYARLHKFSLDCAAGFTDELYRVTRLSFIPFAGLSRRDLEAARERAAKACSEPAMPAASTTSAPSGPPAETPLGPGGTTVATPTFAAPLASQGGANTATGSTRR